MRLRAGQSKDAATFGGGRSGLRTEGLRRDGREGIFAPDMASTGIRSKESALLGVQGISQSALGEAHSDCDYAQLAENCKQGIREAAAHCTARGNIG